MYFEAKEAPSKKAVVILNALNTKEIVNNLTVMSNVSSQYAPKGKVLVSVSCNGIFDLSDQELTHKIKSELQPWFGQQLTQWQHIKTYKIEYALPKLKELKDTITIACLLYTSDAADE